MFAAATSEQAVAVLDAALAVVDRHFRTDDA
jgi:hypothetical protein